MATARAFLAVVLVALGFALIYVSCMPRPVVAIVHVGAPRLSSASLRPTGAFGLALEAIGDGVGAYPKGESVLGCHACTFASAQPVQQPVQSLVFRGASLGSHTPAAGISAVRAR